MRTFALRLILATAGLLAGSEVLATVAVNEPVEGQNISADKALNSTNGSAFTLLGNIVITESASSDFSPGNNVTLVLTAPAGWRFNPGAGSVSYRTSRDIAAATLAVTASDATVTLTVKDIAKLDTLTISGLQVQATDGAQVPGQGYILRTSSKPGTAVIAGIQNDATHFGKLSSVAGASRALAVHVQPSSGATAGVPFGQQPQVKTLDQFGNFCAQENTAVVTARIASGLGVLQGSLTATAVSGVAAFTNLFSTVADRVALGFASTALSPVTSTIVDVRPAAASRLVFSKEPVDGTAGVAVSASVRSEDQYGNPSVNGLAASQPVFLALTSGTGPLQGTTVLDLGTANGNGSATFNDLRIDYAGTSKQVTASCSGLTTAVSAIFAISPAAAARLALQTQPSSTATAGVVFAQQPALRVEDQFGNLRSADNATAVTAASTGSSTLFGSTVRTAANGLISFTNLSYTVAETIGINFSSPGLAGAISSSVVVDAAAAKKLIIQTQPPSLAVAGLPFSPAPVIRIEDQYGNLVVRDNSTTVTAARGIGSGVLQGTTSVVATGGSAAFSNLSHSVATNVTLVFSSGTLASASSALITISPASATKLAIQTQPSSSAVAGNVFALQPVLRVEDSFGNLVIEDNSTVVTAVRSAGAGTLQGTTAVTALNGIVAFTDLLHTVATNITLTFSATSLSSATSSNISVLPASATRLALRTQPGSSAIAGLPFAPQPLVAVEDLFGNTVASDNTTVVTASRYSGAGTLQGTPALRVSGGVVAFTNLYHTVAGELSLQFTAGTLQPAISTPITVAPAASRRLTISQQPSATAIAGVALAEQPVIRIEDQYGNLQASDSSTVVSAARSAGAGALQGTSSFSALNGVVTFTDLFHTLATNITIAFSAAGLTPAVSGTVAISSAPAAALGIQTQPSSSAVAGTAFAQQPVLRIYDQFGNLVSGASSSLITATRNAGSGVLQGTVIITATTGIGTFAGLSHNVAGTISIDFTSDGLASVTSAPITILPSPPDHLAITREPSTSAIAGVPFGTQPSVRAEDQFGNTCTNAVLAVTATRNSGAGMLQGSTTVNCVTGIATFTNLSHTVANAITITFSSGTLLPITSAEIVVGHAQVSRLALERQPSSTATAGVPLAQQPIIRVEDQFGNLCATDSGSLVSASRAAGNGALQGNTSIPVIAGRGTFENLAHTVAGTITIAFRSGALTGTTSGTITISPAPADHLAIQVQPAATATAGIAFSPQPQVRIEDQFGNVVNDNTSVVTVSVNNGSGTLGGALNANAVNGIAAFNSLSYSKAEQILLAFSSGSLTPVTSTFVSVEAAAATRLVLSSPPSETSLAGVPFAQAPSIAVQDQFGNVVSNSDVVITAIRNSGTGTLHGQTVVTAANGLALFTNLYHTVATNITVGFSSPGLIGTESGIISITPAACVALGFSAQPGLATAGAVFGSQPLLKTVDAYGNASTNALPETLGVALSLLGGSGPLQGTTTLDVGARAGNGVASFSNLRIDTAGTNYQLSASAAGLQNAVSTVFAVSPAVADHLRIASEPSETAIAAQAFTDQPAVRIEDAFGNLRESDSTSQITAGLGQGTGTLQGSATVRVASGTARFEGLSYNTAETISLTFSCNGLPAVDSRTVTVVPGSATRLAIHTQPSDSAVAGVTFDRQPVIRLVDAFGNTCTNDSASIVTATRNAGAGSLQGTTAVRAASGFVAFTDLAHTTATNITITFSSGALSSVASSVVGVAPAAASKIAIVRQPSPTATAGSAFVQQPVLQIQDTFGNLVGSDNTSMVTVASNTGTGTLQGTLSARAANGIVSFTNLFHQIAETITLGFDSPGLSSATSGSIAVNPGQLSKLRLLLPGESPAPGTSTGKSGTALAQAAGAPFDVIVEAVDAFWNLVSTNDTVSLSCTDSSAALSSNSALVSGTITLSATLKRAGTATLTATDLTRPAITPAVSSTITVSPGAFATLQLLVPGETAAPGTLSGRTGTASPQVAGTPFTIRVNAVDADWNVVPGIADLVTVSSSDVNAVLPATTALSAGTQSLTVSMKTVGSRTLAVADSSQGTKAASSSPAIPVIAGPFAKIQILVPGETAAPGTLSGKSGTPVSQTAGTSFNVSVSAVDSWWNCVTNVSDAVAITSSDSNALLPSSASLAAGAKSFPLTLRTAGSATVTAADLASPAVNAGQAGPISVNPGAFSRLQLLLPGESAAPGTATGKSGTPVSQTAGVAFTVTVNAVDAAWNAVPNASDSVALSSSDPNAVLPGTIPLSGSRASFNVALKTAGSRSLTASDVIDATKTASPASSVTVNPGAFARLRLLTPGETAAPGTSTGKTGAALIETAGSPFYVSITAVDALWNQVGSVSDYIHLTSSDIAAVMPFDQVLVNGTNSMMVVLTTPGMWSLTAADASNPSKTADTSLNIAVNSSALIPATRGQAISADSAAGSFTLLNGPAYQETVVGSVGLGTIALNVPAGFAFDTGSNVSVMVSGDATASRNINDLASGSVIPATVTSNTIAINVTARSSTGVPNRLTWQNIRIRPLAGAPLMSGVITNSGTASLPGVYPGSSFGLIREVAGAANRLTIETQPGPTAVAGIPFSPQPVVSVRDQFANRLCAANGNSDNGTVISASRCSGSGLLQGTLSTACLDGTAVFTNLAHQVATNITVAFTETSVTGAVSSAITITPASATRLVFTIQPGQGLVGTTLSATPVVRTQDEFGNESTVGLTANQMVRIALSPSEQLLGTTSLDIGTNDGNGVAAFPDLRIDTAGTNYQLLASAAGLSEAVSLPFNVAPAQQTITFPAVPPQTYGSSPITLSASSSSGLPVSFSVVSGPGSLLGNSLTLTGAGNLVVRASQTGDVNWTAAVPVDQSIAVGKAGTATIVTANGAGASTATLIASVSAVVPSPGAAGGNVRFMLDGNPLSMAALSNGVATVSVSALTPGLHLISADYLGNADFNSSSSAPAEYTVTQPGPAQPAVLASPVRTSQGIRINLTGSPGYVYHILRSESVQSALSTWQDIGTVTCDEAGVSMFTDPSVAATSAFYSAVWIP